jgi:RimJ/RimL family protein N-acetyltransferase
MKREQRNDTKVIIMPAKADEFEMYYRVRCERTDYTWGGFAGKPDRENLKNVFMQRVETVDLSIVDAKKIFLAYVCNSDVEEKSETVGFIQISHNCDGMEIGYSIMEKYQGLGMGTEMVKCALEIAEKYSDIVYAQIRDDNIASQRVVLKNGFVRTDEYVVIDWRNHGKENFRKYVWRGGKSEQTN